MNTRCVTRRKRDPMQRGNFTTRNVSSEPSKVHRGEAVGREVDSSARMLMLRGFAAESGDPCQVQRRES
jgi:hypothetical protein